MDFAQTKHAKYTYPTPISGQRLCMCGSRGGGQGLRTPPSGKSKKYRCFSSTGPDPLKIVNLSSQHSIFGHNLHASENGVSLAGRWWPANSGFWIIPPPFSLKKKKKKRCQSWTPLTKLSGSAHAVYLNSCCDLSSCILHSSPFSSLNLQHSNCKHVFQL